MGILWGDHSRCCCGRSHNMVGGTHHALNRESNAKILFATTKRIALFFRSNQFSVERRFSNRCESIDFSRWFFSPKLQKRIRSLFVRKKKTIFLGVSSLIESCARCGKACRNRAKEYVRWFKWCFKPRNYIVNNLWFVFFKRPSRWAAFFCANWIHNLLVICNVNESIIKCLLLPCTQNDYYLSVVLLFFPFSGKKYGLRQWGTLIDIMMP